MANPFDSFQGMFKNKKRKPNHETGHDAQWSAGGDAPGRYGHSGYAGAHNPFGPGALHEDDLLKKEKNLINMDGTPYARTCELDIFHVERMEDLISLISASSIGMDAQEKNLAVNILSYLKTALRNAILYPRPVGTGPFGFGPFGDGEETYEEKYGEDDSEDYAEEYAEDFEEEDFGEYEEPAYEDEGYEDGFYKPMWEGGKDKHAFDYEPGPGKRDDGLNGDTLKLFPVWLMEVFQAFELFVRNKQADGIWLCLEILSIAASNREFINSPSERMDYLNAVKDLSAVYEMKAALEAKKRRQMELATELEEAKRHYESREESVSDPTLLKTIKKLCDDIEVLFEKNRSEIMHVKTMLAARQKRYLETCLSIMLKKDEDGSIAVKAHEAFGQEARKRIFLNLSPMFDE